VLWLKESRKLATRYEKLAVNFLAMAKLALIQRCMRILESPNRTSCHKTAEVERLIRAAGAEVRYLPAYSPCPYPLESLHKCGKPDTRSWWQKSWDRIQERVKLRRSSFAVNEIRAVSLQLCSNSKAYSPELNPIEELFGKLKGFLRSAAARTADALIGAMGDGLRSVTPGNILGWFDHSGYRYVQ
jgi:transposase